jgi:hypothetical protein
MSGFKTMFAAIAMALTVPAVSHSQDSKARQAGNQMQYGTNIVRLAPITAMDIGVGFGVSYEKIFGDNQMVGIILPVTLLLENSNNNDVYTGAYNQDHFNTYVYFTPGVKIYPFGQRKVNYSVGPNLMLGYGGGKQTQTVTNAYGAETQVSVTSTRLRLGLLVNNYVNFQVSPLFNLGLEGGLGMRYYDKTSYSGSSYYAGNGDFHNGFDITGQFSLTLGLRF